MRLLLSQIGLPHGHKMAASATNAVRLHVSTCSSFSQPRTRSLELCYGEVGGIEWTLQAPAADAMWGKD